MADTPTNAQSSADAPEATPAVEEMKSIDTSGNAPEPTPAKEAPAKADDDKAGKGEGNQAADTQRKPDPESDGAGDDNDAPSADDPAGKKQHERLPRWVKERMERVRRVTEAETRERTLREFQEQNRSEKREPPATQAAPTNDKSLEDFEFDYEAYTAYKVEREIERREQKREAESANRKQAEARETFKAKIDAFEDRAGAGAWSDIEESTLNTNPKFKPLVDLFMGDDHDLEIAHHLATNPDEAEKLIALPPMGRMRELTKLADGFSGSQGKPAPNVPKKITNAPPPPKTVAGSGKPSVSVDDEGISSEQRIALWQAQRRK